MYGIPASLDISFLHGTSLVQVCLGQHQVQFHFHPVGCITVEGRWELIGIGGEKLANSSDATGNPSGVLNRLLGQQVVASEVSAPDSFTLRFDKGDLLRIFDDSEQYESFCIQPGNIVV